MYATELRCGRGLCTAVDMLMICMHMLMTLSVVRVGVAIGLSVQ